MSDHTRLQLALGDVIITDEFWERRREVNRKVTLENQLSKLDSRIENLRRAGGLAEGDFQGPYHNDPPVYKWLEAACYELRQEENDGLRAEVDRIVDILNAAQQDDGYLHSNFILGYDADDRFTNLHTKHELFALGHLIEAAIAHRSATGSDRLLTVAERFADHTCDMFGPDGLAGYPGHPEVELALVRLYRETGASRYLDLAKFFVDERGRNESRFEWEIEHPDQVAGDVSRDLYFGEEGYDGRYSQDHVPVREQETVEGHAVRATFLYAGMTDVAMETDDDSLVEALETLWENMTTRRMYVTGGIGSTAEGEAFEGDFELPNESAYAETCAAFGNIIWNQRMLQFTGDGRFGDVIETLLYNGFLAGISLDGTQFCYTNPLENGDERHRKPWYQTSCCPPNVARLLASLETYIYSKSSDVLAVDQYVSSEAETAIDDTPVTVRQDSDFPWDGEVTLAVDVENPTEFDIALRVPKWCECPYVEVNGASIQASEHREDGYIYISRTWTGGDDIRLRLPMEVARLESHPSLESNAGREALRRGPLIYCFEEVDNPRRPQQLRLAEDFDPSSEYDEDILEGVVRIDGQGLTRPLDDWGDELYRRADETETENVNLRAIPYYAWDNREPGGMQVWLRSD